MIFVFVFVFVLCVLVIFKELTSQVISFPSIWYLYPSVALCFVHPQFHFPLVENTLWCKNIMLLKCWLVQNFTRRCTVFKFKLKNSTKFCGNLFLCFKEKRRFWSFLRVSRCGAFCKSCIALSAQLSMEPNSTWGCN